AGVPIMTANGLRPQLTYLGFPIVLSRKLPGSGSQLNKAMLLFGDLSMGASLGLRRKLTISTSGERYFENRQVAFMIDARFDFVAHDLGDTTNAGAVVALMGA